MIDLINRTTFIRNLIISAVFGIVIPYLFFGFIDPNQTIFNLNLIISNGIIFVIVYSSFGLFKKDTFIRLIIGIGYIITLVYFYTVGSNVFSMYLPHCNFADVCLEGSFADFSISFEFDYAWMVILLIGIKGANLIRHYIKPSLDKEEDNNK